MTTYAEVQPIIYGRFKDNWTATKLAYKNVASLDYDDANKGPLGEGTAPYISIRTMFGESGAIEIVNNPVKRTYGSLAVDFYVKKDTGMASTHANIDTLAALFEYQKLSGIVFRELVVMQSKAVGSWMVTPTLIRFYFDRT